MLLPMELRMNREADGQLQYTPFRPTLFTNRGDELATARGPGALFREEWNSLAGNAQRYKPLSLYRTERDVNPTPTSTVQRFYNPQDSSDLGVLVNKKGSTGVALKSSVARFHRPHCQASQRGPGSYFPDRHLGAFPALFDKVTPRTVRLEKWQAKRALAATFGIVPAPPDSDPAMTTSSLARRGVSPRIRQCTAIANTAAPRGRSLGNFPDKPVETTRLAPALTPRNAYQNATNRQFILSVHQAENPPLKNMVQYNK
ncbi:Excinuclease ABC subunit A [Phytophthora cinnamomi]|uniref:Excinuclease ABC subunit A n=1 Tax=Phytophthora cinnamomi TaxID=4785 RepID=UPI00355A4B84|nr:Excinuclease ABC subunit A [Phytophthora cinnamomi]